MSIGYGDNDQYECFLLIRRKVFMEDTRTVIGEYVSYEDASAARDALVKESNGFYSHGDFKICSGTEVYQ